MEDKRIRLVFKDDDILSETQKSDGLNRSWVLLKPRQHDTVSDVASHLLRAFQLQQSCPHGVLLSISGFVLPPFESTRILKDNEIIRVQKRRDVLTIAGNSAANDVGKLKAVEKQPVSSAVLLLANEEFEKEKGGYESDNPEEDDEEDMLKDVENENPSCENADTKSRKRKAPEKLRGSKKKKQRAGPSENVAERARPSEDVGQDVANDVHTEKNENSFLDDSTVGKLSGKSHVLVPHTKSKNDEVQENEKETEDGEIAPEETKKRPSRSARRKTIKRRWLKEMAKIQKQNATCESEGLRNWKEDQAKANKRKPVAGPSKGMPKWKKHQPDAERNEAADDQPKGLLHWKQSTQENWSFKGKKRHQRNQNGDFFKKPNQNGDFFKKTNQKGDVQEQKSQNGLEQSTQNGDGLEQPCRKLTDVQELPGQNSGGVQEQSKQQADVSEQLNQDSDEDNEIVPVLIRPGYIRFQPLGKEQVVEENHAPSETFQWNGITSKKKGQQWGKENHSFTPRNDYQNSNIEHSEVVSNEKEKQPDGLDFDKLPPFTSTPKEGDLIAYRILELSSTWTPELSSFRVGKVSWYDAESSRTMLVPVSEFPILPEKKADEDEAEFPIVPEKKADEDEAAQLDNSLYKEDGSLEIDFSLLIDVRIVKNGSSGPVNEALCQPSETFLGNENTAKTVLPSSSDKQAVVPSQETGVDIWDQLGEALSAKKEQLTKENGWGKPPKKVHPPPENIWGNNGKKVHPSPGRGWGKNNNAHKVQSSPDNSSGKQSSGGKPWSYKALRGSALGPTMAILRSKKDI